MMAWADESQYYVEPKRLARLGHLDARKEPGKSEPLLRLLIADLVGEPTTRASMTTLREDIADLFERPDRGERAELPHRRKSLLPATGFMRRLLALHLELIDEVERELDATEPGERHRPGPTRSPH